MRILYIGGFELPDRNAAAHRVLAIAKALRLGGHDVSLHGITKTGDTHGVCQGFPYTATPYPSSMRQWVKFTFCNVSLTDIDAARPDVVIAYNYPGFSLYSLRRHCRRKGIKLVGDVTEWYQIHGHGVRDIVRRADSNLRMRWLNKRIDGVIAISSYLERAYAGSTRCIVAPPMVDLSDQKFGRDRDLSHSGKIKLIYSGSPSATKDKIDEIIGAISGFENITFTVIGITAEQYRAIYNKKEIPDNVVFLGRVPHMQALSELKTSDFEIFYREGSRVNNAGFPTKFVESVSCGIPVVTTLTSDLGKHLIDGHNGFVISGQEAIADTLSRISKLKPAQIEEMKRNCLAMDCFDYRAYSAPLDSFLKSL